MHPDKLAFSEAAFRNASAEAISAPCDPMLTTSYRIAGFGSSCLTSLKRKIGKMHKYEELNLCKKLAHF
jgi:hypothetical protein